MIWFCFPLEAFYPLQSHIRGVQLGRSDVTTVCLIQCFIVTDTVFSYLQGPLGYSFILITNPFHISEDPVSPDNIFICYNEDYKLTEISEQQCVR